MQLALKMAYSVMSDYDRFCKHYDAVMRDPEQKAVFLKSLIKKRNSTATTLLELPVGQEQCSSILLMISRSSVWISRRVLSVPGSACRGFRFPGRT